MSKKSHAKVWIPDELTGRAKYYSGLYNTTIASRPRIALDHYHLLYHLDLLGVLLTEDLDSPRPKTLEITALEVSLLFHEWIGFVVSQYMGAYYAAARTLRWIFESSLGSAIALIDGRLLLGHTVTRTLTLGQFKRWLRLYDARLASFPRKDGLRVIGLSSTQQDAYNELYSSLCKFSHLSARSFGTVRPVADLVVDMKYFDAIAKYAYRSMDLALYCILKATISQWDITEFLDTYLPWFRTGSSNSLRNRKFPLTFNLVKSTCTIH